jgi:hypothetical protein
MDGYLKLTLQVKTEESFHVKKHISLYMGKDSEVRKPCRKEKTEMLC